MNNAEIADNGVEFYADKVFELADQYITECLSGNGEDLPVYFRDAIFYIHDRLEVPDHSNAEGLDALFSAYLRLCTRYGKLPTLECFSFLTGINRATFCDWANKEYRASTGHSNVVEKWRNICKSFVVDELTNNERVNPNLIFVAKAAHGLRETSPLPAPAPEEKRMMAMDELPILGRKDED